MNISSPSPNSKRFERSEAVECFDRTQGRLFNSSLISIGENLKEHIFGDHWPEAEVRQAMLEEAVEVIRLLWRGGQQSYYGCFYTVENARV